MTSPGEKLQNYKWMAGEIPLIGTDALVSSAMACVGMIVTDITERYEYREMWETTPENTREAIKDKWTQMVVCEFASVLKTCATGRPGNLSDGQQT
jgi:hypothetical protein